MKKSYSRVKIAILLILLSFSITSFSQVGSVFTHVATTGISSGAVDNTAFAVSKSDNKMYVAFRDNANSGKLTVMQYTGTTWAIMGTAGISAGAVNYSIGIATFASFGGNEVVVAFSDAANGNRLTIMQWNGTGWLTVGLAGSQSISDASSISMTVANNGDFFVAYSDLGSAGKGFVKKRINGSWTNITPTNGLSASTADDIDIACDNDNQPYIVYKDGNTAGKATVKKFSSLSGSWLTVGTEGFTSQSVSECAITIDRLNRPSISYSDGSINNRATVRYFDGSTWQAIGLSGISSGSVLYTSLIYDYDNVPYIMYRDASASNKLTVKKHNGASWVIVGTSGFSAGIASYGSMEFDTDQGIYIAYKDAGVSDKAVVQQLSCNSAATPIITSSPAGFSFCAGNGVTLGTTTQTNTTFSWYEKIVTPDVVGETADLNENSTTNNAAFSSTTDANGTIYVVRMVRADSTIRVKRFTAGAWQDVGGIVGKSYGLLHTDATDIAFDPQGNLYVAYVENSGTKSITLKKFVSGNWVNAGPTVTEQCNGAALSINSYGVIALVTGKKNGFEYNPTAYINYGTGWVATTVSINDNVGYLDVCFDKEGNVIYTYTNSLNFFSEGIVRVVKYNGTNWTNLNVGISTECHFVNIACDNSNNLYLSTSFIAARHVLVMRLSNGATSWVNIRPTDTWNNNKPTNAMALDNDGTPYVVYTRLIGIQFRLKIAKYVGSTWVDVGATLSDDGFNNQAQLIFDNRNVPYLLNYYQSTGGSGLFKGEVFQIEKKFLSTGTNRFANKAGNYFVVADAGCGNSIISSEVTVTQTSATNNWTGAVNTEFTNIGNWSCNLSPSANDEVIIPAGAPRYPIMSTNLSANVSVKKLTIEAGASLNLAGQTLNVADSLIVNGTLNASTTGSKLVMNGTTKQTLISPNQTFYDLTINNIAGVVLLSNVTIANNLLLSNGKLDANNRIISANTITGFSSTKYIITKGIYNNTGGRLSLQLNAGASKIFPIGYSDTTYNPITIVNTSGGNTNVSVSVINGVYPAFSGLPIGDTYVNCYWDIRSADANTFSVTPQWNLTDENSIFNRTNCEVYTNKPVLTNKIESSGSGIATTVGVNTWNRTLNNVASLVDINAPKYINITSDDATLPIQLLNFSAKLINNDSAEIKWQITSSSNPKVFMVEKSTDGISFYMIGSVNGNSSNNSYLFFDNNITTNGSVYYRLTMVDLDGKTTISNIVSVYIDNELVKISKVYPQPISSNSIKVTINATEIANCTFVIRDIIGKEISNEKVTLMKGENNIILSLNKLSKGIFFLTGYVNQTITNTVKLIKD